MKRNAILVASLAVSLSVLAACGDDDDSSAVTTTTNVSSTGGGGGAGGSGSGGSGGSGGSVGAGGGGGGSATDCLPSSVHDALFTIADSGLCVVETYDADVFVGTDANYRASSPTWGTHGGPLLVNPGATGDEDNLRLIRLSLNAGMLTSTVDAANLTIPSGFFLGAQAIDLPGTNWTLVSWTGLDTAGELIAIDNGSAAASYATVGLFAGAAVGTGDSARVIHSGLSELEQGNPMQGSSALYAADFCAGPALCAQGASQVASWGSASGPVTSDQDGNVLAVLTNPSFLGGDDMQTARGFAASAVAHGSAASAGDDLFTVEGFGYALAASSPAGNEPGLLMYQPFDPLSFAAKNVLLQRYGVAGDAVVAQGMAVEALSMTTAGTEVVLVADPQGRIWVGHGVSESPAMSQWFVLDRAPQ